MQPQVSVPHCDKGHSRLCLFMQMCPMITKEGEICYTISFYLPCKQNSVACKLDQSKTEANLSFLCDISEGYYLNLDLHSVSMVLISMQFNLSAFTWTDVRIHHA